MEQIKKTFLKKYFTKYYIFGYCCILGFIPQSLFIYGATLLPKPFNYIALLFLTIGSVLLFRKLVLITALSKKKYRFYKTALEKLESGRYDKNYFLNGMYDPCFRVIVKDLLYQYNRQKDYQDLKDELKIQSIPIETVQLNK